MKPQLLLIAPDNIRTRKLRDSLDDYGYRVTGDFNQPVSAVILAGGGSVTHWRQMAGLGEVPFFMWLDGPGDVAAMLREGADDCVSASADISEVLARVEAMLRRNDGHGRSPVISFGGVRVDLRRGSADMGRGAVPLTPKELHLFSYLASHAGAVIAREELLREVWGYSAAETRTVDTHMAALRRKLETNPRRPEHLFTVRGRGYQFRL